MRAEVRIYHLGQGNKQEAVKVELFHTMKEARERCELWSVLGYIAIPVKAGKVQALKDARPPGWGKIQAARVLVERVDRDERNRRRRIRRKMKKLGFSGRIRRRASDDVDDD